MITVRMFASYKRNFKSRAQHTKYEQSSEIKELKHICNKKRVISEATVIMIRSLVDCLISRGPHPALKCSGLQYIKTTYLHVFPFCKMLITSPPPQLGDRREQDVPKWIDSGIRLPFCIIIIHRLNDHSLSCFQQKIKLKKMHQSKSSIVVF